MSAILPPAAPPPPPSGGGGGVAVLQVLANAKALDGLTAGALVDAVAQARAAKGLLEAMTASGPVQLKALPGQVLPAIPDGARLTLQMIGLGAEAQLRLLAINGRPLTGAAPLLAGQTGQVPAGAPMLSGAQPAVPQSPQGGFPAVTSAAVPAAPTGLIAMVIRPALPPGQGGSPPDAATAGLPADLPAGSRLTVRIAGVTPPPPGPAAVPPPAASVPAAPQPATGQSPVPSLPPSALSAAIPLGASPAGIPVTTTPTLQGTVVAHPPGGQAVVGTAIGTLALPVQGDLAAGTVLRLEVAGPPQPPAAPPAAAASRPEGLTAAGWPALTETIQTLAGGDRQALDLLLRVIPHDGPRLAASLSLFALAQRGGDRGAVIGETTTKALDKAGRRDLAERLKADFDTLSADSARSLGGGEWRCHTLPFLHGGAVDPIRLYVRDGGDEQRRAAGNAVNDQRFVLDFALSNLGRLQLDGLVRREEKLFDLIIRTGEPLPDTARRDIMGIFTSASELAGTKGVVSFQSGGRWVEPLPDAAATRIEA